MHVMGFKLSHGFQKTGGWCSFDLENYCDSAKRIKKKKTPQTQAIWKAL